MVENFDTLFPELSGTMEISVQDEDDNPNLVMELTKDFKVIVDWHLKGNNLGSIGGTWHVAASVESLGDMYEGPVGTPQDIALTAYDTATSSLKDHHFHAEISVTPAAIPTMTEGVYKVVTLITYKDLAGVPGPMAAFSENPIITLYQPS
jgi:hypothetical protein